mgnify:CR=1 FL=1
MLSKVTSSAKAQKNYIKNYVKTTEQINSIQTLKLGHSDRLTQLRKEVNIY